MPLRRPVVVVVFLGRSRRSRSQSSPRRMRSHAGTTSKEPLLEVSLLLAELQWAPRADVFVKGFPGSESRRGVDAGETDYRKDDRPCSGA